MEEDLKKADKLNEIDHLRLKVIEEKIGHIEAEVEAMLFRSGLGQTRLQLQQEWDTVSKEIADRYGIQAADVVNNMTGAITRKPIAPLQAV